MPPFTFANTIISMISNTAVNTDIDAPITSIGTTKVNITTPVIVNITFTSDAIIRVVASALSLLLSASLCIPASWSSAPLL